MITVHMLTRHTYTDFAIKLANFKKSKGEKKEAMNAQ